MQLEGLGAGARRASARAAPHAPPLPTARLQDLLEWAAAASYGVVAQEAAGSKPSLCVVLYRAARFQLWWGDTKRSRAACCALLYADSSGATQVGPGEFE
jgi:hypothetical protein